MAVLRDWSCLNPACGAIFESSDAQPRCAVCKAYKVRWRPSGGHIQSPNTNHADRTLRSVASNFGLTDLKSARAGEAAHPGVAQPKSEGTYMGIPWSPRGATSGFAKAEQTVKIGAPTNGARFKQPSGSNKIPTQAKFVDSRKIPL